MNSGDSRPGRQDARRNAAAMKTAELACRVIDAAAIAAGPAVFERNAMTAVKQAECLVGRDNRRSREQQREYADQHQRPPKGRSKHLTHSDSRVTHKEKAILKALRIIVKLPAATAPSIDLGQRSRGR